VSEAANAAPAARGKPAAWQRALPWLITLACFSYLYLQIDRQAARQGQSAVELLLGVFGRVPWATWLASRLAADPPLTPAMLGVLEHDDDIDPAPACRQLGIELTPLDAALRAALTSEENE
jgi:hypothetical protein